MQIPSKKMGQKLFFFKKGLVLKIMVFYDGKIILSLTCLVLSLRVLEALAAQQASALRI